MWGSLLKWFSYFFLQSQLDGLWASCYLNKPKISAIAVGLYKVVRRGLFSGKSQSSVSEIQPQKSAQYFNKSILLKLINI